MTLQARLGQHERKKLQELKSNKKDAKFEFSLDENFRATVRATVWLLDLNLD